MNSASVSRTRYLVAFLLFSMLLVVTALGMIALGQRLSGASRTETDATVASPLPVIIIDAGHGGEDGGAVGESGVLEKDINLKIAHVLDEMLRSAGYPTVMTRTDDRLLYDPYTDYKGRKKRLDLEARVRIAESQNDAIFVSIHMNAFPQSQYRGLQVYYSEHHPDSARLAEQIQGLAKNLLMTENDRRIKPSGGTSYLLEHIAHPSVLVECGFLSNPEECRMLATEDYQRKLATVLFCAVTDFCESEKNAEEIPSRS